MPLFAKNIPKRRRKSLKGGRDAEQLVAGVDLPISAAGLGNARQIAFNISHKTRHTALAEALGELLQGHGFPGTRRAGNDAVTIRHLRQ